MITKILKVKITNKKLFPAGERIYFIDICTGECGTALGISGEIGDEISLFLSQGLHKTYYQI